MRSFEFPSSYTGSTFKSNFKILHTNQVFMVNSTFLCIINVAHVLVKTIRVITEMENVELMQEQILVCN